jgi:hypothetical protein
MAWETFAMNLISSEDIKSPKIEVSPPSWIRLLIWLIFILIFVVLFKPPIGNSSIKYVAAAIFGLVMFGILRNQFKGNYLVTMQANKGGLYFQTSDPNRYYYVPWHNVGMMEKAVFSSEQAGFEAGGHG